jgi:hypothetical protein
MSKTITFLFLFLSFSIFSNELTKVQADVLKNKYSVIEAIAKDPQLVAAVKAVNTTPLAEYKEMTQEKWKELTVLDPKVRYFSKVPVAELLKSKKDDSMTEMFLNASDGTKVAFLSKTTNWSHKGKPKHDEPMNNKNWQGKVEVDESTGTLSIQISVPVLEDGKPIDSLIVGFSVGKLI